MNVSEPVFWLTLFVILIGVVFLLFALHAFLKKKLNIIEKDKSLLYGYVNEMHKKVDRTIFSLPLVFLLLGIAMEPGWVKQFPLSVLIALVISEIFRAIMEYKYSEIPNVYKLTISRAIAVTTIILLLLFIVYKTDLLKVF